MKPAVTTASLLDGKLVQRAAVTGITLEVTLMVVGHYAHLFRMMPQAVAFCAMMFAGLCGLFYARDFAQGYAKGALGGAIAGGTSGIIGVSVANVLGDITLMVLAAGTVLTILTGAIGGLFGQMAANIRKMGL